MALVARLPESSQCIVIEHSVLDHMAKHRQLAWYSREAGGQLFGTIGANEVVVCMARGPYRRDQRWRFSYRSNRKAAQRAIDEMSAKGLIYLGEWHTHPEEHPVASAADHDAMVRLMAASTTKLSSLLMLIQGRVSGVNGVAVYSSDPNGLTRWQLSAAEHALPEATGP